IPRWRCIDRCRETPWPCLLARDLQDLHGIRTARYAAQFTLGQNDGISLIHQFEIEQQAEYREVERLSLVRDVVGDRINAAVQSHPAAREFMPGKGINRNIR